MSAGRRSLGAGVAAAASVLAATLAACSVGVVETAAPAPPADCVDDSRACIERRSASLKAMVADKGRAWVRQPASAHSYAAGVRLFAFKSRKRDLTCQELLIGVREADAAPRVLKGPEASGLSPAQISRGAMLAAEVSRELKREMQRRGCNPRA